MHTSWKQGVILGLSIFLAMMGKSSFASMINPPRTISTSPMTLTALINYIEETNPQITAARAEVESAKANAIAQGKSVYNPEITISGERITKVPREDTLTAGVSQTLDLFNKQGARYRVGTFQLCVAQWHLSQVKQTVLTQVFNALVRYRMEEQQVALSQQRLQLLQRFVTQVKRQLTSGDTGQDALDQAQLAYADAITQAVDAKTRLLDEKQQLVGLTGLSENRWPTLLQSLPALPPLTTRTAAAFLAHLPLLQMSDLQFKTAAAQVKVTQTDALADPTVSLIGGRQRDLRETQGNVMGLSVSVPLFVLNNYHAQIVQAHHTALAAEQERLNVYQEASARLWGTYARYQQLSAAFSQWQSVANLSLTQGIQLLERLWIAGTLTTTDYLIQLKQRLDSRSNGITLAGETWQAWFEWLNASGQVEHWAQQQKRG